MSPAGLARRYAAWSLDATLLLAAALALCHRPVADGIRHAGVALDALTLRMADAMLQTLDARAPLPQLVQSLLADPLLHAAATGLAAAIAAAAWPLLAAFALCGLAYHAAFEASRWQATPGKRALGLRVVDDAGARLSWIRAALRQAAGGLSWITLNIGHLVAALPPRHRALHDAIAGARVMQAGAMPRLPGWARAWLAAQAFAGIAATAWLMVVVDAALQAAFDRALAGGG